MKLPTLNPFPHALHDTVDHLPTLPRRRRVTARVLAAVLAFGLPLIQTIPAIAGEQVLEIPSVANPTAARPHNPVPDLYDTTPPPSSDADAYATSASPSDADSYANSGSPAATTPPSPQPPAKVAAANSEAYAPDPNVGSIGDYQNQPGENGQQPSFALGRGGSRPEPASSMTANLILGGILVGMVALEVASAHHRHR